MTPDPVVSGQTAQDLALDVPVLRTREPLDAVSWSEIAPLLSGEFPSHYLSMQRWSGAKAGPLRDVRAEQVIPFPSAPSVAVAIVHADAGGAPVRYQLPLVRHPYPAPPELGNPLALLVRGDDQVGVYDAAPSAEFHAALRRLLVEDGTAEQGGARLVGERLAAGPAAGAPASGPAGAPVEARVSPGEQSNTSIIYADGSIVKLFRRLETGEHPDVEIGRFLAGRPDFQHAPRLLGVVHYTDASGSAVAAMRQQLVPGARDAWAYTLDAARRDLASARGGVAWTTYTADAERLGAVTRRLHEALAADAHDPAFAPEPATRADVARWASGAAQSVERGLDLLEGQLARGAIVAPLADEAASIVAWRDALLARAAGVTDAVGDDAGLRIRHHGDYHLGQVLRGASGEFFIIDFEGEPLRPLAERRAKHSPLRDVAGMLRSFAYAAATVASEERGPAEPGRAPDPRAAAWEQKVRTAFLGGYFGAGSAVPAAIFPTSRAHADALVTLFELEKLFYELAYELQNRPDWVWIPLLGVAGLMTR